MDGWFGASWSAVLAVALGIAATYGAVIIATKLRGLRSFAKMSSFDFAMTIAIGTIISSTAIARDPPLLQGLAGIAALYLVQSLVAVLRFRFERFAGLVDNRPVLLVENGRILDDNLRRVHITHEELRSVVRGANLPSIAAVRAAVMETTGEVSVISGDTPVDPELLRGVERGR